MKGPAPKFPQEQTEESLSRIRRLCLCLPDTFEKLSHGEPTFFAGKKVFTMFANNHHNDGHLAVWLAAGPGVQENLTQTRPRVFFRPPYVGVCGWIGIELSQIEYEELGYYILEGYRLIKSGKPVPRVEAPKAKAVKKKAAAKKRR